MPDEKGSRSDEQIQRLADFFMEWCPEEVGEGSAVDNAIHIIQKYLVVRGPVDA